MGVQGERGTETRDLRVRLERGFHLHPKTMKSDLHFHNLPEEPLGRATRYPDRK